MTVDELYAQARDAARQHPELVRYREVGHSSEGEAIPMVSIGTGPVALLFYACPHPNEPIGAMLVSYLLDQLLTHEDLRGTFTWHLLPCIDPDGTRLNEGWFNGPFTIRHYAAEFYRPPGMEQVEWTFPVQHKRFTFDAPIPETQALMAALREVRPTFVYALHNAGFGGVYYYISRDLPEVYPAFHHIPESLGLVLAQGEPEMPWAVEFAPAIFKDSSVAEAYDYFETFTDEDPARLISSGGSSGDFLNTLGEPRALALVTELPYFQASAVADHSLTPLSRREVRLTGLATMERLTAQVEAIYQPVRPLMTLDSRLHRAFRLFHEHYLLTADSQRQGILNDEKTLKPATVAQKTDALYVSQFYQLLIYSMLDRAIRLQQEQEEIPALETARQHLKPLLEAGFKEIETNLEYQAVPIRRAVQMQLGAFLAVLPSL
nr:M14 family zinc carboxypeptidase [Deinococcus humi]